MQKCVGRWGCLETKQNREELNLCTWKIDVYVCFEYEWQRQTDRQTLFAGHAPDSLLHIMLTASIHNVKNPVSSVIRMTLYRNPHGPACPICDSLEIKLFCSFVHSNVGRSPLKLDTGSCWKILKCSSKQVPFTSHLSDVWHSLLWLNCCLLSLSADFLCRAGPMTDAAIGMSSARPSHMLAYGIGWWVSASRYCVVGEWVEVGIVWWVSE